MSLAALLVLILEQHFEHAQLDSLTLPLSAEMCVTQLETVSEGKSQLPPALFLTLYTTGHTLHL